MQFITRPLEGWNQPETKGRKRSPYSLGYNRILDHLERELEHLQVKGDVVIQINVLENQLRRDGLPYADVRPRTPRVAIAFTCKYGPMVYRCDAFTEWTGNVRAIGLGLERLRLVEATGITSRGEQYTGFKRLGSGIEMPAAASVMTVEEAARVVVELAAEFTMNATGAKEAVESRARFMLANAETFNTDYRRAAKRHHYDAGGDPEKWKRLQAAAEILEKHHKARAR